MKLPLHVKKWRDEELRQLAEEFPNYDKVTCICGHTINNHVRLKRACHVKTGKGVLFPEYCSCLNYYPKNKAIDKTEVKK